MKNKGMLTRVISGIVCLVAVLVAGIVGRELLMLAVLITSVIGLHELYKALGICKDSERLFFITAAICTVVFYICIISGANILLAGGYFDMALSGITSGSFFEAFTEPVAINRILSVCAVAFVLLYSILVFSVFLVIYVVAFPKYDFRDVAYAFSGFVYVTVFMSFIYFTRAMNDGKYIFWLIFISSWVCDTCAYFVGSAIGKHKLAPILSPKKSIEGSIGGVVGSVIVAFVFGYFIEYKLMAGENHVGLYMVICAVGSILSQVGDLAASGIKRNHDIKDYGKLIPGHGGILDRFDSVIFIAPVIYTLAIIFI